MAVITIISDMGSKDHYLASIKGAIHSGMEQVNIVDISHEIRAFNLEETAYMLRNCWMDFPKGTVHIIAVGDVKDLDQNHLCVRHRGHFFIGTDNGIFSLLFEEKPEEVFSITLVHESDKITFPTKSLFVSAACHLARGGTPEVIGRRVDEYKVVSGFKPVFEDNVLKGRVLHIDRYGNVVTNIRQKDFEMVRKDRDFVLMSKKAALDIRKISNSYKDVSEAKGLCFFNTGGYLEISIRDGADGNGGGANQLFGLKLGNIIRIEFNVG